MLTYNISVSLRCSMIQFSPVTIWILFQRHCLLTEYQANGGTIVVGHHHLLPLKSIQLFNFHLRYSIFLIAALLVTQYD